MALRYVVGNSTMMGGGDLVYESLGNVVSVMIQYRLGVFGKSLHCQSVIPALISFDRLLGRR